MELIAMVDGMLERYLKGEPLTEELAALERGEESGEQAEASAPAAISISPIDDDDREHLRRLILEPGWPVVMRLLNDEINRQENFAKAISMSDPLGRRDEVANSWAYIAMQRRLKDSMVGLIEQEISKAHSS